MNSIRAFFKEYLDELQHKVQWPKMEELQSSTITVLVSSLMIALLIYIMDLTFNGILQFVYQLFQ